MARTVVFHRVAADAHGRRGYSQTLHDRVDALVHQWLSLPEGSNIGLASREEAFAEEVQDCTDYVLESYKLAFGVPLIAWLLPSLFGGIISWLVQRTLDRLFRSEETPGTP